MWMSIVNRSEKFSQGQCQKEAKPGVKPEHPITPLHTDKELF